ncbi:HTH domain-containing protein [Candidatus Woesearchaeota archaeon]|nr:HTH domain-containing protein [Candidatus Woesearchaeota archaeon]
MGKIEVTIEKIKQILLEDTRGLTIQELADQTKVSRVTCGMALMKLEGQGVIDVRVIGNCKLHYWSVEKEYRQKGVR